MAKKIVSVGAFVTDLVGRSDALPVRGQSVIASSFGIGPGGKGANPLTVVGRVGGQAQMVTKLGNDEFGKDALAHFKNEDIDTTYVFQDEEVQTGVALIFVNEKVGENLLMIYPGASGAMTVEEIEKAEEAIANAGVVMMQSEIPQECNDKAKEIALANNVLVLFDPAPARETPDSFYDGLYAISPNETETEEIVGIFPKDLDSCRKAAEAFFAKGVKNVILTLGENGYYVSDGNKDALVPPYKVNAVDPTGAGDCFSGSFASQLAEGKDLFEAAQFASAASALSVTKPGAGVSMPYLEDVKKLMEEQPM